MNKPMIYLDNNATTEVDPAVIEEMLPFLREQYGNPSSLYRFGAQTAKAIGLARERVAALLGCEPEEIIFTSCGTESNNAALVSALAADRDRAQVITTRVEHSAIQKHCEGLAKRGQPVRWIEVDGAGMLDLEEVRRAISDETAILSVMWANNETGVLFPIAALAELAQEKGILFHTDAVQAVGKIPLQLRDLPIQYLSISGHKLHCPKGVGALYVNRRARFQPYLIGGGQEGGRRAGTENVASIVALGKAAEIASAAMEQEQSAVRALRDDFESCIAEQISGVEINGNREMRLPNTSSLAFDGIEAEALLLLLDKEGVCVSAGSACTTGSLTPSHVLTAMGFSSERARASLRFSFSRFNTQSEVDRVVELLPSLVTRLRGMRQPGPVAVAG